MSAGRTRARLLLAAVALAAVGACAQDELAGPSQVVGPPLLDISLGPSGDARFPGGTVAISANAARDTLTLTLTNLPPLPSGSSYQFFLADSATADSSTNNLIPVAGRVVTTTRQRRPVNRDSSVFTNRVDTAASAAGVTAADTNQTFVVRIVSPEIRNFSHVVVAVSGASAPTAGRLARTTRTGFLYARYRDARGTPARTDDTYAGGTFTFGSFAINTAERLPFSVSGSNDAAFFGSQLRINLKGLVRPPAGFRYAGWLVDDRTNTSVRLGGIQSPVPENASLDNADVGTSAWLTSAGILEAQIRADTSMLHAAFENFTRVLVVLEPSGTAPPAVPSAAVVLAGTVPGSVSSRSAAPGKIFGTITSASGRALNTTVYLTGPTNSIPVLVTSAAASGAFQFRTVPTGSYRLYAIPVGASAPSDSAAVTVGSRMVGGAAVGDSVFRTLRVP